MDDDASVNRLVDLADHPVLYIIAMTLAVFALGSLLYWMFLKLGWQGPASLFR